MGGQVLGGGVIVLVAVALWLVYLLPSWYSRHQYTSAERNAVRLNQALRVLAETSETPREVQLELNARTAMAQSRLARQAQAEKERTQLDVAKAELEVAKAQAHAERETVRAERAARVADARAAREMARRSPDARRARARRRFRLTTTVLAVLSVAATGFGLYLAVTGGALGVAVGGGVATLFCATVLHRLSRVAARAVPRADQSAPTHLRSAPTVRDFAADEPRPATWTPRELPRPLVASAGSRAAAVLDTRDAHDALRAAAREEAVHRDLTRPAPAALDDARPTRAETVSPFSGMGYVDDAEIEDHVRQLLARRASGQ